MARKVFISVLGAGLYEACKYVSEDFCALETRFVQQATLEYLHAREWPEESMALILLTDKARKENWEVEGDQRWNARLEKSLPYVGLRKTLEGMNLPFTVRDISIPDGGNEKEMWAIFDQTYELLEEGDELYFDLTHSFRYLPMLMLVFGNYAKFLKKATVHSITYGNYEGRNHDTNEAPIINLLPLSALQDWTFATADYLENGYTERLAKLAQEGLAPLRKNVETREHAAPLDKMVKTLNALTTDLRTCRGMNVIAGKEACNILNYIDNLQNVVITALGPVLNKVKQSTEELGHEGDVRNMIQAAQWCYDKQMYQQAITFLEEGVISYFCQRHGIALDDVDRRDLVSSAFVIRNKHYAEEEWKVDEENRKILKEIVDDEMMDNESLVKTFIAIQGLRNDYNHCGMRENGAKSNSIIQGINDRINDIGKWMNCSTHNLVLLTKDSCFINLSNHPTKLWTEKQLAAAEKYGKVMDMEFPHIKADMSAEDIEDVAEEYVQKIREIAKDYTPTVHIMGELNFVFHVVTRLKERGIECVASTTERHVEENADGSSTRHFDFVRFRRY